MSHPYPGAYPVAQATPKYRPLRRTAIVSIVLMGLTTIAAVGQAVLLWTSYEEVKRFVYGLLSEDEVERGIQTIVRTGPLLDLVGYLLPATGIAFIIWLWQARENTDILKPPFANYQGAYGAANETHRHSQGWTIGGWFCPIVQFWFPLQVVEDVLRASEPPNQPGAARSGRLRALLYGWWISWVGFWVILAGGGSVAVVSFIVWVVRLVDRAEAADATGDYVDVYDLQDFMVRVALAVNIGFTVAAVLLIIAGVTVSLLLLQVTAWQNTHGRNLGPTLPGQAPSGSPGQAIPGHHGGPPRPVDGPPQYAPRPAPGPHYGPGRTHHQPGPHQGQHSGPGNQHPGLGPRQPGPGHQQVAPGQGQHPEPGPGYQQVGPGHPQGGPGQMPPGSGHQQPGSGHQQGGPGQTSPAAPSRPVQTYGDGQHQQPPGGTTPWQRPR